MKDFKTIWKALADSKTITSANFVQLAALKAVKSNTDTPKDEIFHALMQRYFIELTNTTKLTNGYTKYFGAERAVRQAVYTKTVLGVHADEIFDSIEEEKMYRDLIRTFNSSILGRKYVYIFTAQKGLTAEQQGVQAAHAAFVLGSQIDKKINPSEVYFQWVGVEDDSTLLSITQKHAKHKPVTFREPDLSNVVTSVAMHPVLWSERAEFKNYQLLAH